MVYTCWFLSVHRACVLEFVRQPLLAEDREYMLGWCAQLSQGCA